MVLVLLVIVLCWKHSCSLYEVLNNQWRGQNITFIEFYPITLAIKVWGAVLANQCISFHIDSLALVSIINTQTLKTPEATSYLGFWCLSSA